MNNKTLIRTVFLGFCSIMILPVAVHAQWQVSGSDVYIENGNVGIGTAGPGAKLGFGDLNDGRNTADGITWYNPAPLSYGIYRTVGPWTHPDYQQLKLSWSTGIILDPGTAYGKSYVNVVGGGLRVNGSKVCQADGTNCPAAAAAEADTLQSVTDRPNGNTTTKNIQANNATLTGTHLNLFDGSSVVDDLKQGIYFHGDGYTRYAIYKEAGSWSSPFPDLYVRFHTGLKLGAHGGYGGVSIWEENNGISGNNENPGTEIARFKTDDYGGSSISSNLTVAGQVGIGTASPGAKLDVAGNVLLNNGAWFGQRSSGGVANSVLLLQTDNNLRVGGGGVIVDMLFDVGGGAEEMVIKNNGSVGIGTVSPGAKLDVAGNIHASGDLKIDGNIAAKYQDVAEWVPSAESIPPATVVVLDAQRINYVEPSSQAYDTHVAGVISQQPGIILGEPLASDVAVATSGRVKVKTSAENGPIAVGDLLVTSSHEGMAMRSEPLDFGGTPIHRPGTIIGKALEPLTSGEGEIMVLLTLQ